MTRALGLIIWGCVTQIYRLLSIDSLGANLDRPSPPCRKAP